MRWMLAFSSMTVFVFSIGCYAAQLIIEPGMGREPILRAMNRSKHSIDLVMYGFTDEILLNSLLKQQSQGKTVNIILEKQPYKTTHENVKTIKKLNKAKIPWIDGAPDYRLTHQKTLIIDNEQAIIMTFNFTKSTFKRNKQRNFALIIDNPAEVKEIAAHFSSDWHRQPTVSHSPNLIWSPEDSREKIISLINQAKEEIDIYAQNISDFKIIGALTKAAKRGVKVNILTSVKLRDKQANYLQQPGITIRDSDPLYIHAKALLIDHRKAVVGSINFTRASLDDNRELSVVTNEIPVVQQLEKTFKADSSLRF